jgi:hypothetical protein
MTIRALRILPPLAIARLGSSPETLENYNVEVVERDPLAFRRIVGANTFVIDRDSGNIRRSYRPDSVRFKDASGRVKPVAPFLEAWADVDGELVPLTLKLLAAEGFKLADVQWRAHVGNHKAYRRTNDAGDKIEAETDWFGDHTPQELRGRCQNFVTGRTLPFGDVQYLRPSKEFPEIRLRFTPAKGLVYGATARDPDPQVDAIVYDSSRGGWSGYADEDQTPSTIITNPPDIYANPQDGANRVVSLGYLDDECDGIVEVRLGTLSAFARIGAGPPDYAPDSFPVRTVADELEQALLGPDVGPDEVSQEWTEEILRRAFETVRLQNTTVLNGNPVFNGGAANSMSRQDTGWGRAEAPIMAPAIVDQLALRALHQSVFTALSSDTAAWFGQVLRDYDQVGDLTDAGRRRMPAMMRNADSLHLALTRRQVNAVRGSGNRKATAADAAAVTFTTPTAPSEQAAPAVKPKNQTAQAGAPLTVRAMDGSFAPKRIAAGQVDEQLAYRAAGNPPGTLPTTAISNCFPGLEFDFRNVWKRMFEGIELHESDNLVVGTDDAHNDLRYHRLLRIHIPGKAAAQEVVVNVRGPDDSGTVTTFASQAMEWTNVFAYVVGAAGTKVVCDFTKDRADQPVDPTGAATVAIELTVRRFFEPNSAVIARGILDPGQLTQSLCSPWQNDYRECACYYWAASRPDYVNVEAGPMGTSIGENWMQVRGSGQKRYQVDDFRSAGLFTYLDIFKKWETVLRFEIEGRDTE